MDLIANQKVADFSTKAYWDSFFKDTRENGKDSFEWYGNWDDIQTFCLRNLTKEQLENLGEVKVLVVGCGNSTLSEDMFNSGFKNVTSVDYSDVVIEEMKVKYQLYPELIFLQMDVLNMPREYTHHFDLVVDKGLLDAVYSDNKNKSIVDNANKLISEIIRVLNPLNGTYCCVTLAQSFITELLYEKVSPAFQTEVNQFTSAENKKFCPFHFSCQSSQSPCFRVEDTLVSSFADLSKQLHRCRVKFKIKQSLESSKSAIILQTDLIASSNIKYNIRLIKGAEKFSTKFGVFVVPQGMEVDYSFTDELALQKMALSNLIGFLFVVTIGRAVKNPKITMSSIQTELSPYILKILKDNNRLVDFADGDEKIIPFFGIGSSDEEKVGSRQVIYESGNLIVEDVTVSGVNYRRLIFSDSPHIVQSEARLELVQNKTKQIYKIDPQFLCFDIHEKMVEALNKLESRKEMNVLILGLGGGSLASHLLSKSAARDSMKYNVTTVEIDEKVNQVALKYFDLENFKRKKHLTMFVEDGIDFLHDAISKGDNKFNAVLIDIGSSDRSTSASLQAPSKEFLNHRLVVGIKEKVMSRRGSALIINLASCDRKVKSNHINKLRPIFDEITYSDVEDTNNTIVGCYKMRQTN